MLVRQRVQDTRSRVIATVSLGAFAAVASAVAWSPVSAGPDPAPAPAVMITYRLRADSSRVEAHATASGLLGFAGHEHSIAITGLDGELAVDAEDATRFALGIEVETAGMRVIDPNQDEATRARIEKDMKEKVLETARFPLITLRGIRFVPEASAPAPQAHRGTLTAELTLHGVSREITVPLTVDLDHQQMRASGEFTIRHRAFNLRRIKVAGLVNVAEDIHIEFDLRGWKEATTP